MLSSISKFATRSYQRVTVTVDGKKLVGEDSQTIMDLLKQHKVQIPSYCGGQQSCQLCTVLVDGEKKLSCHTLVHDGMEIITRNDDLTSSVLESVKKMNNNKPSIANAAKIIQNPSLKSDYVDTTTHSIQIDYNKCTDCGKCVDACEHNALLLNPHLQTSGYFGLASAGCTSCGICLDHCPEKAITFTNNIPLYKEAMADKKTLKVCVLDSAIFYNLEKKLGLQQGSLNLDSVCALLKNMGFEYFLDYSLISDLEIIRDAARIHRHSQKGFAQTIGSYCPSLTKKLLGSDPTGAEQVVDCFLGPQIHLTTFVVTDSPARRANSTLYWGEPRAITSVGITTDEFAKIIKDGGYNFEGFPCKMFPLGSEQGCKAVTSERFADAVVHTFGFSFIGAHFTHLNFKKIDPLVEVAEFTYHNNTTLRAAIVDGTKGLEKLYQLDLADVIYISPKDGDKCDAPKDAIPEIDAMAVKRQIKLAQDNSSAQEVWKYFMKQEDDEAFINKPTGYFD